jgi:hypothetical protein
MGLDRSIRLAFALFHAGHSLVGLGFGLEGAAHTLHGCRRLAVHHRAFVACRIERQLELLCKSRCMALECAV